MLFIKQKLESIEHNSHYLNRYFRLIEEWNGQGPVSHHILPASLFPEFKSLKKNKWNNAKLTYRQHYIIHWILWKAFPNNLSMFKAFWGMTNKDKQKIDSKTYSILRERHVQWNKDTKTGNKEMSLKMSENRKNGTIPSWNKGIKGYKLDISDEGLKELIRTGKIKPSEKTKKLMSVSMSSKPRVCCIECKSEVAAHHMNRHLNGSRCV